MDKKIENYFLSMERVDGYNLVKMSFPSQWECKCSSSQIQSGAMETPNGRVWCFYIECGLGSFDDVYKEISSIIDRNLVRDKKISTIKDIGDLSYKISEIDDTKIFKLYNKVKSFYNKAIEEKNKKHDGGSNPVDNGDSKVENPTTSESSEK